MARLATKELKVRVDPFLLEKFDEVVEHTNYNRADVLEEAMYKYIMEWREDQYIVRERFPKL